MAWLGVVTNAGKELLGGWLAGQTLQITRATGGSGTVREAALLAQTELVEQQQAASIVSYKTVEGGSKIKLQFPAAEAAYQLNQIGIWGNVGGADVLLALFQNAEGVLISSRAEFPDFAYTFYAVLAIGNEAALAVTVDAEAWVTIKTLQEVLADYVKVNAEGKIPDAVLPPMDYIPKTEKNAAGGVAGLDANRKIVLAQLPVDEALSANSGNPVQNKVINAALAGKVPTGRKVNGKALTGDISLTAADVGAAASGHSHTAAQVGAAASNHTHTAAQVGALANNGKAATAGTADTAKACSGNAATATKLATARSIRTNLASGSAVNFDGSGNITPGIQGILGVANGGTGANNAAAARTALGITLANLGGLRLVTGTYIGNGSPRICATENGTFTGGQFINLGATPKLVIIIKNWSLYNGANNSTQIGINGEPPLIFYSNMPYIRMGYDTSDVDYYAKLCDIVTNGFYAGLLGTPRHGYSGINLGPDGHYTTVYYYAALI